MEMEGKDRSGKLGRKLMTAVITVTLLGFIAVLAVVGFSLYNNQRYHEIEAQMLQQERSASQVYLIQATAQKIAEQLTTNSILLNILNEKQNNLGQKLFYKREIHNVLASNAHLYDGIEEITIYTEGGKTYSSRDKRGDFRPEENPWFQVFLQKGEDSGYTAPHSSAPQQDGYVEDVISYVSTYHSSDKNNENVYIIVSIYTSVFDKITNGRTALMNGCELFDADMRPISGEGIEEDNLSRFSFENAEDIFSAPGGDIYLSNRNMSDGWMLVCRVSGDALVNQCFGILGPIFIVIPILVFFMIFVIHDYIRSVVEPLNQLEEAAGEVGRGNFDVSLDIHTGDELETTADAFNKMTSDIKKLMDKSLDHERKIQQMNMENLLLQINPHFIYNTMNSITEMARRDNNEEIAEYADHFNTLLHQTLTIRKSIFISINDEMDIIGNYIYLQKYRYGDKFDLITEIDDDVKNATVPVMLLEPIVENAIFHGLAPKPARGKLIIKGRKFGENLYITIADDGIGMTSEVMNNLFRDSKLPENSIHMIGIGNVQDRVKEIYGRDYGMEIKSRPGEGTEVTFRLPFGFVKSDRL